jgi:hypothetical protein
MPDEIDMEHYCVGDKGECEYEGGGGNCEDCPYYHRKWPTPAQYKAEYGRDWPDDGAVYCGCTIGDSEVVHWISPSYFWEAKDMIEENPHITCFVYCACAPWGKPPDDWRPE